MDVWTNGTLGPDEAVSLAAKVLNEHLKLFIDLSEVAITAEVMIEKADDEKEKVLEIIRRSSGKIKRTWLGIKSGRRIEETTSG